MIPNRFIDLVCCNSTWSFFSHGVSVYTEEHRSSADGKILINILDSFEWLDLHLLQ